MSPDWTCGAIYNYDKEEGRCSLSISLFIFSSYLRAPNLVSPSSDSIGNFRKSQHPSRMAELTVTDSGNIGLEHPVHVIPFLL